MSSLVRFVPGQHGRRPGQGPGPGPGREEDEEDASSLSTSRIRRELIGLKRSAGQMVRPDEEETEGYDEPLDDDGDGGSSAGTSMDLFLPETNIGYKMLRQMGWVEGTGLGRRGTGRLEPINVQSERDALGRSDREDAILAEVAAVRKLMEVEVEETDELRAQREAKAQRDEEIKRDVAEITKVFLCELCEKQYKKASEYEAHLSSYDHHHKKVKIKLNPGENFKNRHGSV